MFAKTGVTAICIGFDLHTIREELHDRKMREAARANVEANYQRTVKAWVEQLEFIIAKAQFDCTSKCAKAKADRDADLAILEAQYCG